LDKKKVTPSKRNAVPRAMNPSSLWSAFRALWDRKLNSQMTMLDLRDRAFIRKGLTGGSGLFAKARV